MTAPLSFDLFASPVPGKAPGGRLAWLRACVELARPAESAVVLGGTLIGARLADAGHRSHFEIVAFTVSNVFLFAASMVFNDWRDVREDSIDKPHRPVPSGRVSLRQAFALAAALFLVGIAAAFLVHPRSGVIACAITLLSVAYSLRLKSVPLLGHAVAAAASSYPLWCWLPLTGHPGLVPLALSIGLAVFRLGAEIVKAAEDHRGDSLCGIRTLATAVGVRKANLVGSALLCIGKLAFWAPLFAGTASPLYLVALGAASLLGLAGCARSFGASDVRASRRLVALERATMAIMTLALLL